MPTFQGRKCKFTENQVKYIDYKDVKLLQKYLTKFNKVVPRYYSGNSLKHQKMLTRAIKRARTMALIPFTK